MILFGYLSILAIMTTSFVMLTRWPIEKVFLRVYLPCLLLLPQSYSIHWVGFPEQNFHQAAIEPILLAFLIQAGSCFLARGVLPFRVSLMDFFVVLYVLLMTVSDYVNNDFWTTQNHLVAQITNTLGPYFLAKALIEPKGLRNEFARLFVLCVSANLFFGVYEQFARQSFWYRALDSIFPGQGMGWSLPSRWGMVRMVGAFSGSITSGMVFAVAYRIARWIEWSELWEPRLRTRYFTIRGISKGLIIRLTLLFLLVSAVARGPWVGALMGGVFAALGRSRDRIASIIWRFAVFLIMAAGVVAMYQYYKIASPSQIGWFGRNIRIRINIIDQYWPIILEKFWLGHGLSILPRIHGLESLDNFYLLTILRSGIWTLAVFVAMTLWQAIRLLKRSYSGSNPLPRGSKLSFTLFSVVIFWLVCLGTVWLGPHVTQIFFLLLGWNEGYLLHRGEASAPVTTQRQLASLAATNPAFT